MHLGFFGKSRTTDPNNEGLTFYGHLDHSDQIPGTPKQITPVSSWIAISKILSQTTSVENVYTMEQINNSNSVLLPFKSDVNTT